LKFLKLFLGKWHIYIRDQEFEAHLSRNYQVGYQQNRERIGVQTAFMKAAKARGVDFNELQEAICGVRYFSLILELNLLMNLLNLLSVLGV
jgi:hypothetical protein